MYTISLLSAKPLILCSIMIYYGVVDADADELRSFQRCHEVDIGYFYHHETCSLGGYDPLQKEFGNEHVRCWGGVATAPG